MALGASGAIAVVDNGHRTWRLSSGAVRLDPGLPMRADARFRVGSVTKTFVATVALQLVGEGKLRLDDTVQRWVPGLVPGGDEITLRMLLNHTSGLFNYTEDPEIFEKFLNAPTTPITPRQMVAVATEHPPTFPPGEGWSYSNTGYIVAGLMLEAASGQSAEQLVRRRIIAPLGLSATTFPQRTPYVGGYHAHGYVPPSLTGAGYRDVTPFAPSLAWTAGAIVSTATDLRTFHAALLGGRLLRPYLLAEMTRTVPILPVIGYGLGIGKARGPCGTVWGHTGGIPGYVTFAYNDRSGERGLVVMLPTQPDEVLGSLLQPTVDTAVCQMFGRLPAEAASPAALPAYAAIPGTVTP